MDTHQAFFHGTYGPFIFQRMRVTEHPNNFFGRANLPFNRMAFPPDRMAMDPGRHANISGSSIPFTLERVDMDPRLRANFCNSPIPFTLDGIVMDPGLQASICGSSLPVSPKQMDLGLQASACGSSLPLAPEQTHSGLHASVCGSSLPLAPQMHLGLQASVCGSSLPLAPRMHLGLQASVCGTSLSLAPPMHLGLQASVCGSSLPLAPEQMDLELQASVRATFLPLTSEQRDPGLQARVFGSSLPPTPEQMDPGLQASVRDSSLPLTPEQMDPGLQAKVCGSSLPRTPEQIPYPGLRNDGLHRPSPKPKLLSLFPTKPTFKPLARKLAVRSSFGRSIQQANEQHSRAAVAIRGAGEFEALGGSDPHTPVRDFSGLSIQPANVQHSRAAAAIRGVSEFESLDGSAPLAVELVPQNTDVQIPSPGIPPVDSVYSQAATIPSVNPCKIAAAPIQRQCPDRVDELASFNSRSGSQYSGTSNTSTLSLGGSAPAKTVIPLHLTCSQSGHTIEGPDGALNCSLAALITEEQLLALTCPMAGRPTKGHTIQNTRPSARHGPRPRSSVFRGVTHYKRTGRWEAHIWNKGKQIYLGASATAEKAAKAYDRAAIHFRKFNAELNFCLKSYARELQRLMNISEPELVTMLRKQSAGAGTQFPVYPPGAELGTSMNTHHEESKPPTRE